MKILEVFTTSKTGNEKFNEDAVFYNDDFVVVIDGVTAKSSINIYPSEGRFAAEVIKEAFKYIDARYSPYKIISLLNLELESASYISGYEFNPAVNLVVYNNKRKEIFTYGDCLFSVNGETFKYEKQIDKTLSEKRSQILKKAIEDGMSVEELKENDISRKEIMDELISELKFANRNTKKGYPMLNGTSVIKKFIHTQKVKEGDHIILASDGYPQLFKTLKETEDYLFKCLEEDPLCINELCSTKGLVKGNISFDDRTYIRFIIDDKEVSS